MISKVPGTFLCVTLLFMRIRVLGCHGGELPGFSSVSLLINDTICVDAGSITSVLTQKEQLRLKHVLITHAHMDHVRDLHFLVDNRFVSENLVEPVTVYGSPFVVKSIHDHIFNGVIWPDYTKAPAGAPLLYLQPLSVKPIQIEGFSVQAVSVPHAKEAVGYIVSDGKSTCVFSGDTASTEDLWKECKKYKNVKAIFLELSYSERRKDLTSLARHHCPSTFIEELKKLPQDAAVYAYHLKPQFYKDIIKELKAKKLAHVKILKQGQIIKI